MMLKESMKKMKHQKEIEQERKELEEYDKIMMRKDMERINYSNKIRQKAKLQELRQSLIMNVKESENGIKKELEIKFLKEKEEIEKR